MNKLQSSIPRNTRLEPMSKFPGAKGDVLMPSNIVIVYDELDGRGQFVIGKAIGWYFNPDHPSTKARAAIKFAQEITTQSSTTQR